MRITQPKETTMQETAINEETYAAFINLVNSSYNHVSENYDRSLEEDPEQSLNVLLSMQPQHRDVVYEELLGPLLDRLSAEADDEIGIAMMTAFTRGLAMGRAVGIATEIIREHLEPEDERIRPMPRARRRRNR
jgi:hypothetical protein